MHTIRWTQRFSNFQLALQQLDDAAELSKTRELTDLEKQGLIQAFEYTHELAWNKKQSPPQTQTRTHIGGNVTNPPI